MCLFSRGLFNKIAVYYILSKMFEKCILFMMYLVNSYKNNYVTFYIHLFELNMLKAK